MIAGRKVTIGGKEYTIPPINLEIYFAHKDAVKVILTPKDFDQMQYAEAAFELLVPSIQRNYPDVTAEELKPHLNLPDMPTYVFAMVTGAGFEPKGPLAAKPGTEAPAGDGR